MDEWWKCPVCNAPLVFNVIDSRLVQVFCHGDPTHCFVPCTHDFEVMETWFYEHKDDFYQDYRP